MIADFPAGNKKIEKKWSIHFSFKSIIFIRAPYCYRHRRVTQCGSWPLNYLLLTDYQPHICCELSQK